MSERRPVLVVGLRRPAHVPEDFGDSVSARRMERLLNLQPGRLREAVDCANLMGPEDLDDRSVANMRRLMSRFKEGGRLDGREVLVLCGQEVARAFRFELGRDGADRGRVRRIGSATAVVIPHPSGRSRVWNDSIRVARVEQVLREVTAAHIAAGLHVEGTAEASRARQAALSAVGWEERYFRALAERRGAVGAAARDTGVTCRTVELRRAADEEFALRELDVLETTTDALEATAYEGATRGLEVVVARQEMLQDGEGKTLHKRVVRETRQGADARLLLRALEARRPERWAARQRTEHSGHVTLDARSLRTMPQAELEALGRELGLLGDGEEMVVDAEIASKETG